MLACARGARVGRRCWPAGRGFRNAVPWVAVHPETLSLAFFTTASYVVVGRTRPCENPHDTRTLPLDREWTACSASSFLLRCTKSLSIAVNRRESTSHSTTKLVFQPFAHTNSYTTGVYMQWLWSMLVRVGLQLLLCSLELTAAFKLTSKAFDDGEAIPSEYLLRLILV